MKFSLLHLQNYPIYDQLLLEESLLRNDARNFCLINTGSPPAIVMGISAKPETVIHLDKVSMPILRRFSGGGTVVIDESTIFLTFICNKIEHPFPPFPEAILRWTASILTPTIPGLALRENDFVIGEKKCGGNALYIKKDRWLIHTSFLWDYKMEHMELLKYPPKTPAYRNGRDHESFLCRLRDMIPDQNQWLNSLKNELTDQFEIEAIRPSHPYGTTRVPAAEVDALTE